VPWDHRIHSSTKAKIADGTWRAKRSVNPAEVTRVEAELRAALAVPAPAGNGNGAVTPTLWPFPVPSNPSPDLVAAGVVPPPPAVTPTPAGIPPFPALMQRITRNTAAVGGKLSPAILANICESVGMPSLPALAARPDLIPNVHAALDTLGAM
jgi:hypothetical protein